MADDASKAAVWCNDSDDDDDDDTDTGDMVTPFRNTGACKL